MLDETGVESSNRPRGLSGATILLCGTGTYGHGLTDIPAVAATLTGLSEALVARCGAPAPTEALDPATNGDLGDAILAAARSAEEVLLIYFVGHGLVSPSGRLYLAAAETPSGIDFQHRALPYDQFREFVLTTKAPTRIVILDCCFSGMAIGNLGPGEGIEQRAEISGTYVLTSAARDETAIAPPGEPHTAFGGELINLLQNGDRFAGPDITLESAYHSLDRALAAKDRPRPHRLAIGDVNDLVLTDNPAYDPSLAFLPPPVPVPLPPSRVPILLPAVLAGIAAVPFLLSLKYGGSWRSLPPGVRGDVLRSWWGLLLLAAAGTLAAVVAQRLRGRWRPPLLGIVAFGLTALLGGTALTAGAAARVALATCPTSAEVGVLAPVGSVEPARELAAAFERDTAAGNFGCPEARLLVYSATADQINTALVHGWGDAEHVQIGPAPDVWLADWSGEVRQAKADATRAGRTLPITEVRTIASTPLVLAVPATAGLADGTPWPDQVTELGRQSWDVVVPDPATSVGALARLPLYHPPDGTAPVNAVERPIDRSYDHGKFALGSDATALLCAPGDIRDRTGYVVTEQDVARLNHGDPLGPSCPQRPSKAVRAVYPAGTPILDRQAVQFDWSETRGERSRAAARFTDWLGGTDGYKALVATGLRPPVAMPGAPLAPDWGVQPDLHPRPAVVSVDLVADVRLRYSLAHRDARVVIAIDASGSMGLAAPGGSLWQVASKGATRAWSLLDGRDELGVWAFQGRSVRKLAPLGPGNDARIKATSLALDQIRPRGPAPLYSAIVGAVAAAGPSDDSKVTAVILMTDGEPDNASVLNEKQFRTAVQGKRVRVFAIAMGATGCAAPVLKTITTATAGKCLEADPDSAAGPMAAIFEAVL